MEQVWIVEVKEQVCSHHARWHIDSAYRTFLDADAHLRALAELPEVVARVRAWEIR